MKLMPFPLYVRPVVSPTPVTFDGRIIIRECVPPSASSTSWVRNSSSPDRATSSPAPPLAHGTQIVELNGITADGTLYRSEPTTFTIPADGGAAPATTTTVPGIDLAVGATVTDVSSEFGSNFAATNATDGSGTTEWSSRGDGDAAFITVDLGSTADVTGFAFITRSMADGTAITRTYTVTVDDGTIYGPFTAGTAADQQVAPVETRGRRFRFDVDTSTGGNVGAVEIRVLGPPR